jgi:RNA polymerase sigma factor (sigma-70 family)
METKEHLGDITTIWAEVWDAQGGSAEVAHSAQDTLFQRYGGAVRRYLLAALGDVAAAEDLTQEFALALVEGRFRGADPKYGRFRDYVKGALFHLVSRHRRQQKKLPRASGTAVGEQMDSHDEDSERQFNRSWREELVARAWAALEQQQPTFFAVLHFHANHSNFSAQQTAAALVPQLGKLIHADNLRQMLHRARKMFADLLLADLSHSLKNPTTDALQQELTELGFAPFFHKVRAGSAPA